jgi:glycosyltransferase involved in cell wall biosynthesis
VTSVAAVPSWITESFRLVTHNLQIVVNGLARQMANPGHVTLFRHPTTVSVRVLCSQSPDARGSGRSTSEEEQETVPRQHVLIIVQNLPVPLDRRVWLECQALRESDYTVSVICPKGPGDPGYEVFDGVHLYKYRAAPSASGVLGYLVEFVYCWLRTAFLSVCVNRRQPIAVIQGCNPPDTYWALAKLWRLASGGRVIFVFDHHDLNPEVYVSRFGEPTSLLSRLQLKILRWLERRTFRTAAHVISTNESYRRVAVRRGGMEPCRTTVVRSGPDVRRMRPIHPIPRLRKGRDYLLVYLGIMGPQDGVDLVVKVTALLAHRMGLDVHTALLGFGDCFDELVELACRLDVEDRVTFTGRADLKMIGAYLSSADIGLSPDPLSPLNDVSTMNKTMEYMSYALPVVAFDLTETRVSAGGAACYVDPLAPGCVELFARTVARLLKDLGTRAEMTVAARRRAEHILDWLPQRRAYVGVYDALSGVQSRPDDVARPTSDHDEWGRPFVDVTDDAELRQLAMSRAARVNSGGSQT